MRAKRPRVRSGAGYELLLYGVHTVRCVLSNPLRVINAVYVTPSSYKHIKERVAELSITPRLVSTSWFARFLGNNVAHQGLAVDVEPLKTCHLDVLDNASLVVALDSVTDPHNVGSVFRSAAAFGADAVITTTRNSPRETGVLAKAASGGTELVMHVEVSNLAHTLSALKISGFCIIGLDSTAHSCLEGIDMLHRCVVVLGSEGKGIRPINKKICSLLAKIDLPGTLKSLNVSNAAAVALHILNEKSRKLCRLKHP